MTRRWWRPGDPVGPLLAHLEAGGVAAVPTESSYGLAALPASHLGVDTIYRLKSRPASEPLPVVVGSIAQLAGLGIDVQSEAVRLLALVWPAPLTAVLATGLELPASAGSGTLAVRIPGHAGLRRLLLDLGTPLTATSANLSGAPPVSDPGELAAALPGWDGWVVDGGRLRGGAPSTLVRWQGQGWTVLRPGPVPPPSEITSHAER